MNPKIAQVLIQWIEKNNNNTLSIFELDEENNIKIKKVDDKEVIVYINSELEKKLKDNNFKEEEIKETIKKIFEEISNNLKKLEEGNLE